MSETIVHDKPPSWYPLVADLMPGQRRRIQDGKLVSHNGKGWHLYDFREKRSEVYMPELSFAQRVEYAAARRDAESVAVIDNRLPTGTPVLSDWPAEARSWLWKAHLDRQDIVALGAVWCSRMSRVALPLQGVESRYWVARHVQLPSSPPGKVPKYLFPGGISRTEGALYRSQLDTVGKRLVITEDFLSAYRIWRDTGLPALSAMGTSLGPTGLSWVVRNFTNVGIWLDSDEWGQNGARVLRDALGRRGVVAGIIKPGSVREPDPKCLPPDTVRARINSYFGRTQ